MKGTRGNVANKVNDLKTTLVPKMTQCRRDPSQLTAKALGFLAKFAAITLA
jgi:hypothetical protein